MTTPPVGPDPPPVRADRHPLRPPPTPSPASTPAPTSPPPSPSPTSLSPARSSSALPGHPRPGTRRHGLVWLVRHLELEADRALKLIVSNIAQNTEARNRFKREARVMAKLVHPNAVTVHDARLAGDVVFIEMEFVPGKSLNQVLKPEASPCRWTG